MRKTFNILTYIFAAIGFVLVIGYVAIKLGWTKTSGIIDSQHDYFINQTADGAQSWSQGEEWAVLKEAITKDRETIFKAARTSGTPPRLIVSNLIVEQLRLFHTEREVFKAVFAPLKILGTQSQFSWGVMGIKQDAARMIEDNLKNQQSPFYLGTKLEHALDYPTATSTDAPDIDTQRFNRLTDEHDRYYSYLYAGVYIQELIAQWKKAGIDISTQPAIIGTLFNIGFNNSHPHPNPLSGGAEIEMGDTTYSFGSLAKSFYDSDEMIDVFPRSFISTQ